jgi:hypothetical protein
VQGFFFPFSHFSTLFLASFCVSITRTILLTPAWPPNKYAEAEPLYRRALAIRSQQLGADHPDTVVVLTDLVACHQPQGKDAEAETCLVHALASSIQQEWSIDG